MMMSMMMSMMIIFLCGCVKIFGLELRTPTIFFGRGENDANFVADCFRV